MMMMMMMKTLHIISVAFAIYLVVSKNGRTHTGLQIVRNNLNTIKICYQELDIANSKASSNIYALFIL
jgi:hypothetical protein